jgi:hydroxymethylglutaryl-CoA lyase
MNIIIHDVGLRDGLQIEKEIVPLEKKIEWVKELMEAGIDIIQVGSFVNPKKVPQMADTEQIFTQLNKIKKGEIILSALVLNEKGMERGMSCGVEMFCMGVSASETHSQKNTGMTVSEATERIVAMAKECMAAKKKVQVSVQSAFGCGFEGKIPHEKVLSIVEKYLEAGIKTISLADTAGHANPESVEKLYSAIFNLDKNIEGACHFHNTYGLGLLNCYSAMKSGVKYIETAFGGLGGCPFTKSPSGNVSTEDFVHLLHQINLRHDVHLDRLVEIAKDASSFFKRELQGMVYKLVRSEK